MFKQIENEVIVAFIGSELVIYFSMNMYVYATNLIYKQLKSCRYPFQIKASIPRNLRLLPIFLFEKSLFIDLPGGPVVRIHRFSTFTAMAKVQSLVREIRSHKATWHGQTTKTTTRTTKLCSEWTIINWGVKNNIACVSKLITDLWREAKQPKKKKKSPFKQYYQTIS